MLPEDLRRDVELLWDYHNMKHELRCCDVGIGLGSHDLGVAVAAVDLFHRSMFNYLIFTGANAPTTIERFPHGEAVAYREYALANGVPTESVIVDVEATNTEQNLRNSRTLLEERGIRASSVLLMSRPYQQRRAYATCRQIWPQVEIVCYSNPMPLGEYMQSIGDTDKVVSMLVGDTQRIELYAQQGFAIPQHIPAEVRSAFKRLVAAGFTSRLI